MDEEVGVPFQGAGGEGVEVDGVRVEHQGGVAEEEGGGCWGEGVGVGLGCGVRGSEGEARGWRRAVLGLGWGGKGGGGGGGGGAEEDQVASFDDERGVDGVSAEGP